MRGLAFANEIRVAYIYSRGFICGEGGLPHFESPPPPLTNVDREFN